MSHTPWQPSAPPGDAEGPDASSPLVVLIGPCASGKSAVAAALRARGVNARSVAQEHSVVPHLWRHVRPDLLVYLDVSYEVVRRRRTISWGAERLRAQKAAMAPARAAAGIVIDTDALTVAQVADVIMKYLQNK